jgi:hypothetical protein
MQWMSSRTPWHILLLVLTVWANSGPAHAQVNYTVHFEMEKPKYVLGEPVFCKYVIRNTGSMIFAFRYRTPSRNLTGDSDQEPKFQVTDPHGRKPPDPGPQPCGSPKGSAVYGSVTLPPGHIHTERWLLNQWALLTTTGHYRVRAERRLALLQPDPATGKFSERPVAFALAIDEFAFEVASSTPAQIEAAYQPYLASIENPKDPNPAEAVMVLTAVPQPFFLKHLIAMANAAPPERWDRRDVLNGLARLGTAPAWEAILKVFQGTDSTANPGDKEPAERGGASLRSYALLLLSEKADPASLPPLLKLLRPVPGAGLQPAAEPLRGDILRALGFFHDPRAYQALFDNLHSARVTDRMNSILGLKNLGSKEVIPALLAALNDPEPQVRQVANFALRGLTGHEVAVSANPSRQEANRIVGDWHAWWREHASQFSPPPPVACHDW